MGLIKFGSKARLFGYYWLFVLVLYLINIGLTIFLPNFAGLVYTLSVGFALCGALKLTEELLFPDIETSDVLREKPIAYAIYIFAFAYLFSMAML